MSVVAPAGHNTTSFNEECPSNDDAPNGIASSTSAIRTASLPTMECVVWKTVTEEVYSEENCLAEAEKTPTLTVNFDMTEDPTNSLPATCDLK